MNEWLDGWVGGWIDRWVDGWVDGLISLAPGEILSHVCFQKEEYEFVNYKFALIGKKN